jgi:hypothetical protein
LERPTRRKFYKLTPYPWTGSLRPGSERRRDKSEMKPTAAQIDPKWSLNGIKRS